MKAIFLAISLLLLMLQACLAGEYPPRYAVAEMATPVLNTPDIAGVFGGRDGRSLKGDDCGLLRNMEFVALPGTVFTIEGELKRGKNRIFRVSTTDYPYPAKSGYYIDSRFVRLSTTRPPERPRRLPPRDVIIERMLSARGSRYVWGGNVKAGLPKMLEFYPPVQPASLAPDLLERWQLKGVDCSGLLYEATDGYTPRNTSSLTGYGTAVAVEGLDGGSIIGKLQPLDLIVWAGHVIIVLDRERTIESRLDCGGSNGGVIVRPLAESLSGVMKGRMPVDDYAKAGKGGRVFVIRRWYQDSGAFH